MLPLTVKDVELPMIQLVVLRRAQRAGHGQAAVRVQLQAIRQPLRAHRRQR